MQICPFCASQNIFYSKKRVSWFCEDCDRGFDEPADEKGMRIFISYGHDRNQSLVTKIKDYLTAQGYDVWIDTSCIPKGKDWKERITSGLLGSNGVLAFLSKHSVRSPGVCLDELRRFLKSLVISETKKDYWGEYKVLRFVHKSIGDWITDRDAAGLFWADRMKGYQLLARFCEERKAKQEAGGEDPDPQNKGRLDHAESSYPEWLFKAQRYDDYKRILLTSFDKNDIGKHFKQPNYYYKFLGVWNWVEQLPDPYFTEDLFRTLTEIVTYPKELMCSELAHRSFQISALLFEGILVNGRCREVFYTFMRQLEYARYFMSTASDQDGETRDGWDKFYMTRDVNLCVKKLEKLGFQVPADVLRQCNFMKVTFCFYRGKAEDGMLASTELLSREGFFKDICVLDDAAEEQYFPNVSSSRAFYNTTSLERYLLGTDEEDWAFIDLSVQNLADPSMACNAAEDAIREKFASRPMPADKVRRLAFIEEVRRRYS